MRHFITLSLIFLIASCFSGSVSWRKIDATGSGSNDGVDDSSGAPGTLDTGFGANGVSVFEISGKNVFARGVAIQSDGKIVVGGYTEGEDGTKDDMLAVRFTSSGALDTSFGSGGVVTIDLHKVESMLLQSFKERAHAIAIDGNGKIVLAGYTDTAISPTYVQAAIARLNTDGSLDTTFSTNGVTETSYGIPVSGNATDRKTAEALNVLSDNSIIICGESVSGDSGYSALGAAKFGPNGVPAAFSDPGDETLTHAISPEPSPAGATGLVLLGDGKMIFSRKNQTTFSPGATLSKFTNGGVFQFTNTVLFGAGGASEAAKAVTVDSNGKIVMVGNGVAASKKVFGVARLTSDLTGDISFEVLGRLTLSFTNQDDVANALVIDSQGRIIVAGSCDANLSICLARFSGSGVLDTGWGGEGKRLKSLSDGEDYITGLAIQSDDKIIAVGPYRPGGVGKLFVTRFYP